PPCRVRWARGVEDVLVGEVLVDDVAPAPRAALGSDREAGLAHALDLLRELGREGGRMEARNGRRDVARLVLVHQKREGGLDPAVPPRFGGGQGNPLV